jgi:hypothetical protein
LLFKKTKRRKREKKRKEKSPWEKRKIGTGSPAIHLLMETNM